MTTGLRSYRDELYPPVEDEVNVDNINMFFKFMNKRHMAWYRRFKKHLPRKKWTKDKILKTYKYTNVYRQLDRGTVWALDNIIAPYRAEIDAIVYNPKDYDETNKESALDDYNKKKSVFLKPLIWKLMLYRLCNRIETFEKVGLMPCDSFNPFTYYKRFYGVLDYHAPMTNAHLTCPCPKGFSKIDGYFCGIIDTWCKLDITTEKILLASSGRQVFDAINKVESFGGFISYEVYCDLCYAEAIPFTTNDFVNVGPGATEGIRLLFPSSSINKQSVLDRIYDLFYEQDNYFKIAGIEKFRHYNKYEPMSDKLSLRSVEHSLCEFSKYWLQKHKVGKRRLEYDKWSEHAGFTINPRTGDTGIFNESIYENFAKMCEPVKGSKKFKKFLKTHKNKPNKDQIYVFISNMKKKLS